MARFDVYANPNSRSRYSYYVDAQSNFVQTPSRWCIPLFESKPSYSLAKGVQGFVMVGDTKFVLDTPNMLAVPNQLFRKRIGRLSGEEQALVESSIEFVLRGY